MTKKKILIVDDEKNIRMTINSCLDKEKYQVDIAINGEEGFEKLTSDMYDLVLLDIKMPGMSGLELLRKVRDYQIKTDVVMMTAYGTVENAVEAMKLGAIDFMSKPFTPNEIRNIVELVMSRHDLEESEVISFNEVLEFAKLCILSKDYQRAIDYLKKAVALDMNSPDPHNLLGVLAELKGDILSAQMHYRASLALDPTHKASKNNLERTAQYNHVHEEADLGKSMTNEPGDKHVKKNK
ncbi:MAG: response regulator [Clostridia bacterium]|nr:response regulator [Clostridia bacterium]